MDIPPSDEILKLIASFTWWMVIESENHDLVGITFSGVNTQIILSLSGELYQSNLSTLTFAFKSSFNGTACVLWLAGDLMDLGVPKKIMIIQCRFNSFRK